MKPRTANHNAVVSLIPFFGLTSFWYLGKKKGLLSYGLTVLGLFGIAMAIGIGGILMGIIINGYILFLVLLPAESGLRYFIVKHYTIKRNEELQL